MKLFGPGAELTELATRVMNEDLAALENELSAGWDVNAVFHVTRHVDVPPLILALSEHKTKVIRWLLENNAAVNNNDYPALITAAASCKPVIVQLLIDKGAAVNQPDKVGKTALSTALYGKQYDNIPVLLANGYHLATDGRSLRQAVFNRQYPAIKILLEAGVDVNLHQPDMVFPYNPTAVCVAAQNNDFNTVKLLVEKGADVTIKDQYGERPYNAAVANKNEEMIAYLRALEPPEWHEEAQRLAELKKYKIPAKLLALLKSDHRRMEIPGNAYVSYIEFNRIVDLKEVNWNKHTFLDLLSDADNYGAEGLLVWYPKKKCLASADYEHGELKELGSVDDFLRNPGEQLNSIFE